MKNQVGNNQVGLLADGTKPTKERLISMFEYLCKSNDSVLVSEREDAVRFQNQINIWQFQKFVFGTIRINTNGKLSYITLFSRTKFDNPISERFEFEITTDEYNELEKLYKADFK